MVRRSAALLSTFAVSKLHTAPDRRSQLPIYRSLKYMKTKIASIEDNTYPVDLEIGYLKQYEPVLRKIRACLLVEALNVDEEELYRRDDPVKVARWLFLAKVLILEASPLFWRIITLPQHSNEPIIPIAEYRRVTGDMTSSDERILKQIQFLEALSRSIIQIEIKNHVDQTKAKNNSSASK